MSVIGLDIGGANLKASDGERLSLSVSFPLWKHSEQLEETLARVLESFPQADRFAVTMTGELADCYRTKAEGVRHILSAVDSVAAGREVLVWQSGGEFVDIPTALELPRLVAAANWHALATWAGRLVPEGVAVLLDMGSTTTDIIPLRNGFPMPLGRTDPERLASGELLYFGARRTPLIGLLHVFQWQGEQFPLANELFATTADALLVTGEIAESASCETANGRAATVTEALARLARQLCADETELPRELLTDFAHKLRDEMCRRIREQLLRHEFPVAIILSGEGSHVCRQATKQLSGIREFFELSELLGPEHSRVACAYALARLGSETPPTVSFC